MIPISLIRGEMIGFEDEMEWLLRSFFYSTGQRIYTQAETHMVVTAVLLVSCAGR